MTKKKKQKSKALYTNAQVKRMAREYREGKNIHYRRLLSLRVRTRVKVALAIIFKVKSVQY